jgi:hypothetical protein
MPIYVFDAHGSIESRHDKFDLPNGVNLVVFGLPGAAISEKIPNAIYSQRVALFDNPIAFISSMGISVVGRTSKGLQESDQPSVKYTSEPVVVSGPREVPNLVITGSENTSGSYVYYNNEQGATIKHALRGGQSISLKQAFGPAALGDPAPLFPLRPGDWIIWACCLSVHFAGPITRKSVSGLGNSGPGGTGSGGTAYGFKSRLVQKS